ncbi:hypothetical protein BDR05DRAFT_950965 [Suillus weaverae]|nr:hypothetical protein BDR05DRAFT_950965 [Suillus weaverae]
MHSAIVPPFYDSESGAPPPFPPMLTDQLELFGNIDHCPTTLTADEVLVPRAGIVPVARASSSTPAPEFKLAKWTLKHSDPSSSACSYPKKLLTCSRSQTPLPSDSARSLDSLSDSSTSTSSASLSEDSKIPKPAESIDVSPFMHIHETVVDIRLHGSLLEETFKNRKTLSSEVPESDLKKTLGGCNNVKAAALIAMGNCTR